MLEALGITPVEEQVYGLLLTRSRLSVADLVAKTGLPVEVLERGLEVLVTKGLVRQSAGRDAEYVAAPPDYAIEVLISQQLGALQEVRAAAADLASRHRLAVQELDPAALIEVVSGAESVRQLWWQLNKTARSEIAVFDAPPYAVSLAEAESQQQHLVNERVRLRTVFDRSLLEDPAHVRRIMAGIEAGEQARVARVPLKLVVVDREWGLLPLTHAGSQTPEAVLIIRDSVLLDSLLALFESVWENAVEVRPSDTGTDRPAGEAELRELARLLAVGMTDIGIARHLGISERTVRRRIKDLLEELRAHSRFQAGVRAHERGWL